jgi:hypothetical protein
MLARAVFLLSHQLEQCRESTPWPLSLVEQDACCSLWLGDARPKIQIFEYGDRR